MILLCQFPSKDVSVIVPQFNTILKNSFCEGIIRCSTCDRYNWRQKKVHFRKGYFVKDFWYVNVTFRRLFNGKCQKSIKHVDVFSESIVPSVGLMGRE